MNITLGTITVPFTFWTPAHGTVFNTIFGLDTETTAIDKNHDWITPAYVLGAACDGTTGYFITREHIAAFLTAHQGLPMALHNAAFDLDVLQLVVGKQLDIYAPVAANEVWDTQLLHQLNCLGSEGHVAWGKGLSTLEACAQRYLGVDLPKDPVDSAGDLVRTSYSKWLNQPPEAIEPVYLEYLAKDALATILVYAAVQAELMELLQTSQDAFNYQSPEWLQEQIDRWGPQTHHIQLRGSIVLRAITANGIHVDRSKVGDLKEALEAEQAQLLEDLRGHCYIPGDGSDKALQKILERVAKDNPDLTLPRTDGGKYKKTAEALEQFRDLEPFVDLYLRYKEVNTLLKTYLKRLGKGVLHPDFRALVESGRTSSFGDINAQNLPRSKSVRECLVATPGRVLISADYSTLELATLSQTVQSLSGSRSEMARLINVATGDDDDLHTILAAIITGKDRSEVTSEERRKAKAINFGKPGGMGTRGLIRYAKASYGVALSEDEAVEIEDAWFDLFPEMQEYLRPMYDAGEELAFMMNLTPAEYNEAQGKTPRYGDEDVTPTGWLGGMCLKVLGEDRPRTRKDDREYTDAEIEYYWNKLQENVALFPEEFHADIRGRKPSWKLRNGIRNWSTSCPVFTSTGRLRANAAHCQQKNTPFQGLAADGAKLALWELWRRGKRIVNFIHDEIVIEVDENCNLKAEAEELRQVMIDAMRQVVPDVRISAEYAISRSWDKDDKVPLGDDGYLMPSEPAIRLAA